MMCGHYHNSESTNSNDNGIISLYKNFINSIDMLLNSQYNYNETMNANSMMQQDKLEFEFENFIVSAVVWLIASLLFIIIIALIVLLFVNSRSTDNIMKKKKSLNIPAMTDLEKQLPVIIEEEEEKEEDIESTS